jgi:hypothetical protein
MGSPSVVISNVNAKELDLDPELSLRPSRSCPGLFGGSKILILHDRVQTVGPKDSCSFL